METVNSAERANQSVRAGTLPGSWWAAARACIGRPDFQLHEYNSALVEDVAGGRPRLGGPT